MRSELKSCDVVVGSSGETGHVLPRGWAVVRAALTVGELSSSSSRWERGIGVEEWRERDRRRRARLLIELAETSGTHQPGFLRTDPGYGDSGAGAGAALLEDSGYHPLILLKDMKRINTTRIYVEQLIIATLNIMQSQTT